MVEPLSPDAPFLRASYVAGVCVLPGGLLRDVLVHPYGHVCYLVPGGIASESAREAYRLTVWARSPDRRYPTGQQKLAYEFRAPLAQGGAVLFEGADFGCAPGDAIDSNDALAGLLGFLTLRPGDTDDDYFAKYTAAQRAFAESSECEYLQLAVLATEERTSPEGEAYGRVFWDVDGNSDHEPCTACDEIGCGGFCAGASGE